MEGFLSVETLELIQDTAKESQAVTTEVRDFPNDPEKRLVVRSDGTREIVATPFTPSPRRHVVETVESFSAAFVRWGGTPRPNIWLDLPRWRLLFFTDEPLRRSSVTLKLTAAPQWATVSGFRDAKSLEHKALIRLLRHDLAGCADPGVLPAFRSIDFNKIQNAKRSIEHGKQSMDSDIVAQVTGDRKPEEIVVVFPVLVSRELPDFRARVVLTVDIDADAQRFTLQARPGDLDLALEEVKGVVSGTLEAALGTAGEKDVTILAGSPE